MKLVVYDSIFGPGVLLMAEAKVKYHFWGRSRCESMAEAKQYAPDAIKSEMPIGLNVALKNYFRGVQVDLSRWAPDLHAPSTFAGRVYRATGSLKWGETATYSGIAAMIGNPGAARAVGTALGGNPTPLFIPCHRVLAKNGLGGWSGPPGLKIKLLELEGGSREGTE